ncbi:hypothetical protein U1Q18_007081 [Sarracenia purpurea var. burkii]
MEAHKELQLLPTVQFANRWMSEPSIEFKSTAPASSYDCPSLDLQLSIRREPILSLSNFVKLKPLGEYGEVKIPESDCVEALKWQAAEEIRLAAVEKAYAERVRELTRREMELAQSELARARQMWERAREEVDWAERVKERAVIDSAACIEVTCQSCKQKFRP